MGRNRVPLRGSLRTSPRGNARHDGGEPAPSVDGARDSLRVRTPDPADPGTRRCATVSLDADSRPAGPDSRQGHVSIRDARLDASLLRSPRFAHCDERSGVRPRNNGSMLCPCISLGIGSPATARNVGAKSTFNAIASLRDPALIDAGQRTRNGMRSDSSYMKRLSNMPWSPRKKP